MPQIPQINCERALLGCALLLCILGYIFLAYVNKADPSLLNLAFGLAGAVAGVTVPRTVPVGGGGAGTLSLATTTDTGPDSDSTTSTAATATVTDSTKG